MHETTIDEVVKKCLDLTAAHESTKVEAQPQCLEDTAEHKATKDDAQLQSTKPHYHGFTPSC